MGGHNGTDDRGAKAQRLRLTYARGAEAAEIGQLELTRVWEKALTEAGVELSYSRGNRPQPRVTTAAGLPMGVTGDGELVEAITCKARTTSGLLEALEETLPTGLRAIQVEEVGMGLPSLPLAVHWADYVVDLPGLDQAEASAAIERFLAAETLPWEDARGKKVRHYDLRPLVADITLDGSCQGALRLRMRLRCASDGVGRADQVVKALGFPEPARIHRSKLVLAEDSPARKAWRRRGRYL